MRVCDVNDLYSPRGGGVRTFHHAKLEQLGRRSDVEYTLVVPGERDGEEEVGGSRVVRIAGPRVPGLPQYRLLLDVARLRSVLRRLRPDVLEVGGCYLTPWVVRLAASGLPALRTGFWHTDYPCAFAERPAARLHPRLGALARRFAWAHARATYGRYALVLAASRYAAAALAREGIGPVVQTPLGVDLERFHPRRRDEGLRASVGASPFTPLLLFPHRLIEEKGLSWLLRAFPAVRAERRCVLVFLGTGPREGRLQAWLREEGHGADAHHVGYVADPAEVARWMASADVVLALSPYETFGLAAAEALACGVPVVGADGGAVPEHVRDARAGRCVPPEDEQALAEAILAVLDEDRRELAERARSHAVARYSWERTFARTVEAYAALLGGPQPGEDQGIQALQR